MSPIDGWRNPYLVLGITPRATPMEIERAGQRLLGMLEIGAASARTYETPWGKFERDSNDLRQALAALRDPANRFLCSLWWDSSSKGDGSLEEPVATGETAFRSVGWRGPCTSSE